MGKIKIFGNVFGNWIKEKKQLHISALALVTAAPGHRSIWLVYEIWQN